MQQNKNIKLRGEAKPASTYYTCPMHPDVKRKEQGICNICGMILEPEHTIDSTDEDIEFKNILRKFWIAVALSLPLMILNMSKPLIFEEWIKSPYLNWLQFTLSTPVVLWCGSLFFQRTWSSIKHRNLNMFTLIALGIGVAYIYSILVTLESSAVDHRISSDTIFDTYFKSAAVITIFALLGQILELKVRSKASQAIHHLLALVPVTARIIHPSGVEEQILIAQLCKGDILRVRPGDKIPADGVVLEGSSTADQSLITGESLPIELMPGSAVVGGMVNGTGSFIMRADRVEEDTVLSRIVQMVTKAQRTKLPIQKLVDTIAVYFVPVVILIAIITSIGWSIWGPEPKIIYALSTSVAVLIIACPCALGLATPISITVGAGRGAKEGILIKNAEALESLGKINTLVVDKTSTITEGKPRVMDVIAARDSVDKNSILMFAASIERGSEHPLAEAIIRGAETAKIKPHTCTDFASFTGKDVTGTVQNHAVALGNTELMKSLNIDISSIESQSYHYSKQGHTLAFLAVDNILYGLITVADAIKSTTKEAIQSLQDNGIKIVMLTGDNHITASALALKIWIDSIKAEVSPDDKYKFILALQQNGHKVAMVGDGINDAPALAQANVGIAMGTGTAVAIENASITLMSGDLKGIIRARNLSRATMNNISQNLFLAFIYNVIAIPIAAGVLYPTFGLMLNPMIASAAMALSSLSVILNSVRLARIKL